MTESSVPVLERLYVRIKMLGIGARRCSLSSDLSAPSQARARVRVRAMKKDSLSAMRQ